MSKGLSIFRTISFWTCCALVFVNYAILRFAQHVHNHNLEALAFCCMLCGFIGAVSHYALDRAYRK